jgi:hypothetical protein
MVLVSGKPFKLTSVRVNAKLSDLAKQSFEMFDGKFWFFSNFVNWPRVAFFEFVFFDHGLNQCVYLFNREV